MKDIEGYEGLYAADESGKIWAYPKLFKSSRYTTGRFLKTWLIGHGYEMVMLYKNGKTKKFLVHRLIAITFVPNTQHLPEVNHKNANIGDNRPENLEWVTSRENKQHAIKLGLYKNLGKNSPRGSKHSKTHLKDIDIFKIRKLASQGNTYASIGAKFKMTRQGIGFIVRRKVWKHI